jgi:hypothetical protein
MIVSCHVPKTAGTTLHTLLSIEFGDRLYTDYGDRVGWIGPEADEWRRLRGIPPVIAAAQEEGHIRVVHGHFYASKYADAYPEADLVAFVREPAARVISNYRYLSEHPEIDHPLVSEFHDAKPKLAQWAEWPWARNLQSSILDVPLERFTLIGITEQFEQSLQAFDAHFGTSLSADPPPRQNATQPMPVNAGTQAKIAELNRDDVDLYRRAVARFGQHVTILDRANQASSLQAPSK